MALLEKNQRGDFFPLGHSLEKVNFSVTMDERGIQESKRGPDSGQEPPAISSTPLASTLTPPRVRIKGKLQEVARLAWTRARVTLHDQMRPYKALSEKAKFSHNYVEPLCFWWGRNSRVFTGQCLPGTTVQAARGSEAMVINCTSHNYAGMYKASSRSEALQTLCLELLPVADFQAMPRLEAATHGAISEFMRADFCVTTSTGYGANCLALPALVGTDTVVILDDKCHNSVFTGLFLAQPRSIRKYVYGDMLQLERILEEVTGGDTKVLVVTEGIYSMEGEVPPLDDFSRLKARYNFMLFCDEAHSFLSIGATGRGCIEYWNDTHPDSPVPLDLIDLRTVTLSKSVGGIGGAIFGKSEFQAAIQTKLSLLREDASYESLSASTMVQLLWVLGQPTLVARNLKHVADMALFCRAELRRFGLYAYGDARVPTLPIYTGRPSHAGKLSYVLRSRGLLASPVVTPAVAFWEGRVRIILSAALRDKEVDELINISIAGTRRLGIVKPRAIQRRPYKNEAQPSGNEQEDHEEEQTYDYIRTLIYLDAESRPGRDNAATPSPEIARNSAIIEAGQASRRTYGVGSGGARWISGTFPPHLAVESLIARRVGVEDCLTYPDASLGMASTIAALSRSVIGYKKHYMLLPQTIPMPVSQGLAIASKRDAAEVSRYSNADSVYNIVRELSSASKAKVYLTVYLYVADQSSVRKLAATVERLCRSRHSRAGMTILIHSPYHLVENLVVRFEGVQLLICGSFFNTFGLPGGYAAGTVSMVQELRFTSRGYMYTTSPQPFVMDMLRAILESRPETQG
ncbi:aminotransferase class I and II [Thozetella sp. PMI_491]|nr:aminotransferase class I and II [Thozetella sp. PMI_491]